MSALPFSFQLKLVLFLTFPISDERSSARGVTSASCSAGATDPSVSRTSCFLLLQFRFDDADHYTPTANCNLGDGGCHQTDLGGMEKAGV